MTGAERWLEAMQRMLQGSPRPTDSSPATSTHSWLLKTVSAPYVWNGVPGDCLSITGTLTEWLEDSSAAAAMGISSPVVREIEQTSSGELLITWTTLRRYE